MATVDFTDGEDIADYAYDLFNKWGIGDKKSNNGLLILLSIGAEDYYAEPGVGLTDVFTGRACWTRCCMTTLRTILPRKSTTAA